MKKKRPALNLPSLRELFGQLFRLPEFGPRKKLGLPSRLKRLIEAGGTFRWLTTVPEVELGKREKRRRERQRPRRERLAAESQAQASRVLAAVADRQARRARKARARAKRRAA